MLLGDQHPEQSQLAWVARRRTDLFVVVVEHHRTGGVLELVGRQLRRRETGVPAIVAALSPGHQPGGSQRGGDQGANYGTVYGAMVLLQQAGAAAMLLTLPVIGIAFIAAKFLKTIIEAILPPTGFDDAIRSTGVLPATAFPSRIVANIAFVAIMLAAVSSVGPRRVKPSVYFRPTAQPISNRPATTTRSPPTTIAVMPALATVHVAPPSALVAAVRGRAGAPSSAAWPGSPRTR